MPIKTVTVISCDKCDAPIDEAHPGIVVTGQIDRADAQGHLGCGEGVISDGVTFLHHSCLVDEITLSLPVTTPKRRGRKPKAALDFLVNGGYFKDVTMHIDAVPTIEITTDESGVELYDGKHYSMLTDEEKRIVNTMSQEAK